MSLILCFIQIYKIILNVLKFVKLFKNWTIFLFLLIRFKFAWIILINWTVLNRVWMIVERIVLQFLKFILHLLIKVKYLTGWNLFVNFRIPWVIYTCNSDGVFDLVGFLWFDCRFWMKIIDIVVNSKVSFDEILIGSFTEGKSCIKLISLIVFCLIYIFFILFFVILYFFNIFWSWYFAGLLLALIWYCVNILTFRIILIGILITLVL